MLNTIMNWSCLQTEIETIEKNIILYLLLVKGFKQNVNVQISKYITYGSYKKSKAWFYIYKFITLQSIYSTN